MDDSIFGFFVSSTIGDDKGNVFRDYIWGEDGVSERIKKLKYFNYGNDLKLILLQFYINPISYTLDNLKEIENYRKKEKSIGISIVVDDQNFFSLSNNLRNKFLHNSILQKTDLLTEVINIKGLDTNIVSLNNDLKLILDTI